MILVSEPCCFWGVPLKGRALRCKAYLIGIGFFSAFHLDIKHVIMLMENWGNDVSLVVDLLPFWEA